MTFTSENLWTGISVSQSPHFKGNVKEMFEKFWEMEKKLPDLLASLEDEFQKLFGINIEGK